MMRSICKWDTGLINGGLYRFYTLKHVYISVSKHSSLLVRTHRKAHKKTDFKGRVVCEPFIRKTLLDYEERLVN